MALVWLPPRHHASCATSRPQPGFALQRAANRLSSALVGEPDAPQLGSELSAMAGAVQSGNREMPGAAVAHARELISALRGRGAIAHSRPGL